MAKATIQFYPKPDRINKRTGLIPIYMRVLINRKKSESRLSVDISQVELQNWDNKYMRVASNDNNINRMLNKYQLKFDDFLFQRADLINETRPEEIRDYLLGQKQNSTVLILESIKKYFTQFIESNKNISPNTIKTYRKSINHFERFLKLNSKSKLKLTEFNHQHALAFHRYLLSSINECKKLALSEASAAGNIKRIKTILQRFVEEGILVKNPFHGVKLKTKSPKRLKLLPFEIREIFLYDFSFDYKLEKSKNIFLFCVFTGLSYADAMEIKGENIRACYINENFLEISRSKTQIETKQFVVNQAMNILKEFKSKEYTGTKLVPKYSNQAYNRCLKLIAKELKLNKTFTTHLARHSFRQLIAESGITDNAAIKSMMGHTRNNDIDSTYHDITEKQLLNAKIKLQEYLNLLLN
ncbi:MAG: site-specific integrase [Chitinophagaceae bacterium]|nr:site-specific integrase [Chitinophagaceae bacterium]